MRKSRRAGLSRKVRRAYRTIYRVEELAQGDSELLALTVVLRKEHAAETVSLIDRNSGWKRQDRRRFKRQIVKGR